MQGDKVKVTVQFKGREMSFRDKSHDMMLVSQPAACICMHAEVGFENLQRDLHSCRALPWAKNAKHGHWLYMQYRGIALTVCARSNL